MTSVTQRVRPRQSRVPEEVPFSARVKDKRPARRLTTSTRSSPAVTAYISDGPSVTKVASQTATTGPLSSDSRPRGRRHPPAPLTFSSTTAPLGLHSASADGTLPRSSHADRPVAKLMTYLGAIRSRASGPHWFVFTSSTADVGKDHCTHPGCWGSASLYHLTSSYENKIPTASPKAAWPHPSCLCHRR